ncbi:hypothetical protein WDZ11_22280 (plasmid) [Roseomonas mucosa]|uniref:hypothetical protein n=1 Tax=Roseomonas mucosa TaxID=207340 RepID=UPI0030D4605B
MSTALLATTALPRPPALTTVVFDHYDEEGFQGAVGRCHVITLTHPYRFASRAAAERFAGYTRRRGWADGVRLVTPGHVPPPLPEFDDSEIPF